MKLSLFRKVRPAIYTKVEGNGWGWYMYQLNGFVPSLFVLSTCNYEYYYQRFWKNIV